MNSRWDRRRRGGATRVGGVLLAAALLLVACGSEAPSTPAGPSAQRLILGASQQMFTAGTAQIAYLIAGLGDDVTGTGQIDFAAGQSHTVTQGLAEGDTQVVVDGAQSVLQVGGLTPPGVFVASDPADADQADTLGVINQLLLVLSPLQVVDLLGGASDVEDRGPASAGGVDTTQVHATIDLADAVAALSGPARRALQQVLAGLDTDTVTVDVFLDADGLVRKLAVEVELNDGTVVTVTQRYSRFGEPVDVGVPLAEEVVAPAEAFGLAGADVSGTWNVTTTRTESDDPLIAPIGEVVTETVEVTCDDGGVCGFDGFPWESLGGGRYSYDIPIVSGCVEGTATVEVTAVEDGRATAMTGTQSNDFSCGGRAFTDTVERVFAR